MMLIGATGKRLKRRILTRAEWLVLYRVSRQRDHIANRNEARRIIQRHAPGACALDVHRWTPPATTWARGELRRVHGLTEVGLLYARSRVFAERQDAAFREAVAQARAA